MPTQKELVLEYIKEYGELLPAKISGKLYKGVCFGSETSKRCRELRAEGKLASRGEGKFEVYFLPLPEGKKFNADGFLGKVEEVRSVLLKNEPDRFSRAETPQDDINPVQKEKPPINDSMASHPKARGWDEYSTPESREPKVCCLIYKASKGYAHARGCKEQIHS